MVNALKKAIMAKIAAKPIVAKMANAPKKDMTAKIAVKNHNS
jgi:hypothetical protein